MSEETPTRINTIDRQGKGQLVCIGKGDNKMKNPDKYFDNVCCSLM